MDSRELRLKVDKAQEKVDKLIKTIERHKAQANKKLELIRKNGWNEKDKYALKDTPFYDDSYWAVCEYEYKLEDIKNAYKKLTEAKRILNDWIKKYEKEIAIENQVTNEFPEILLELKNNLAKEWQTYDILKREEMINDKNTLAHDEFRKKYSYVQETFLVKTDEEFLEFETSQAQIFIIDLYRRVKEITGKILDWGNIYYSGNALNGWVEGELGKATVKTIVAGGYNIQELHLRVLVKKIK